MSSIEIVLLTILILLVVFTVTTLRLRSASRAHIQAVQERLPNIRHISQANFFGQESAGLVQMRGTGTLALTDTELYFEKMLPRREYRIPLAAVEAVETPLSYLTKTQFSPLLKVVFRGDSGQLDSMAWRVADLDDWVQALEAARR
jgi:hypothetical protein